ncbi:MAG: tetratricopeptide repeat protein [Thermoanaerobaculia bacterium]
MKRPTPAAILLSALFACAPHRTELPELRPPLDRSLWSPAVGELYDRLSDGVREARREPPGATGDARRAAAFGELGTFHLAYGPLESARTCLRVAHELAPSEPRWTSLLAHAWLRDGRPAEALEVLEGAGAEARNEPITGLWIAELRFATGDAEGAGRAARAVLPRAPGGAVRGLAQAELARLALQQERPRVALEHLAAARSDGLRSPALAHLEAEARRRSGDLDGAGRALEGVTGTATLADELRRLDPVWREVAQLRSDAREHDVRALEARSRGRLELALVELRQALRMEPDRIYARLDIADLLTRLGRPEEAREEIASLLEERPDYPPAVRRLGLLREELGEREDGERLLRRAVELDPLDAESQVALGDLLRRAGRCGEADVAYGEALALDEGLAGAVTGRARCLLRSGEAERAVADLEAFLPVAPEAQGPRLLLARLLAFSGTPEAALRAEELVRSLTGGDTVQGLETTAMVLAAGGDFDAATAAQRRAVEAWPAGPGRRRAEARLAAYRAGRLPDAPTEPTEPLR